MTENKTSKMNLEQERKIAELQERGEPDWKTFAMRPRKY